MEKVIQVLEKLGCVCMDGYQRIVQIELQDAIGTIERAVEFRVDDEIIASDILGSARAGLHEPTSLMRNEQKFFPISHRIPRERNILDQILRVCEEFNRDVRRVFQNFLGDGFISAFLRDKDFFREETGFIHQNNF
jgi:hypothetical protein